MPNTPAGDDVSLIAISALVAARSATIGDLVDFANSLPDGCLWAAAAALSASMLAHYQRRSRARARRELIILGALVTRLAFCNEGLPRDRDSVI